MLTPQPEFDVTGHSFQVQRDSFERRHLPELAALEEYERGACEAYHEARARVIIRVITALILATARSQQDAADRLGIDRTALSVAQRHGFLGSRPLANMFGNPIALARLLERSPQVCRLMARAGFIAAAEYTAANIVRRDNPTRPLTELDYELLCGVVTARHGGDATLPLDERDSAAIATRVLADPSLEVIPEWYLKAQRKEAKCWMEKLKEPAFAHQHIGQLQAVWMDIFVYVWATLEGEGDESLWYAE